MILTGSSHMFNSKTAARFCRACLPVLLSHVYICIYIIYMLYFSCAFNYNFRKEKEKKHDWGGHNWVKH